MPLPSADADPTDPRLFLLQEWHSSEVALTQEVEELKDSVPWVINEELAKIIALFKKREATTRVKEFPVIREAGFRQG